VQTAIPMIFEFDADLNVIENYNLFEEDEMNEFVKEKMNATR
jgi:hypothetical protein